MRKQHWFGIGSPAALAGQRHFPPNDGKIATRAFNCIVKPLHIGPDAIRAWKQIGLCRNLA
jgi:hypothetical protein